MVAKIYAWYCRDAYILNYNKFDENFSQQQLLEHKTFLVLKNNSPIIIVVSCFIQLGKF